MMNQLEDILYTLPVIERNVIEWRFGFKDGTPKTLAFCSGKLGFSRERIRQFQNRALRRLRHPSRVRLIKEALDAYPIEEELLWFDESKPDFQPTIGCRNGRWTTHKPPKLKTHNLDAAPIPDCCYIPRAVPIPKRALYDRLGREAVIDGKHCRKLGGVYILQNEGDRWVLHPSKRRNQMIDSMLKNGYERIALGEFYGHGRLVNFFEHTKSIQWFWIKSKNF